MVLGLRSRPDGACFFLSRIFLVYGFRVLPPSSAERVKRKTAFPELLSKGLTRLRFRAPISKRPFPMLLPFNAQGFFTMFANSLAPSNVH